MKNDLATEITGRVRRLLDGLLATRAWRRLSVLPPLGQRLFTRYSDWVDGLFSRLHSPLTSALLLGRSSNLQLLPLSYAWFDRRWIDRRKKSRSFWRQSGSEKDEDKQMPAVPEYFFEEDADEGLMNRFQSEPADDIILSIPTLMNLAAGNTGFTRPEQLAKKIALRLELLTNKGSPTPWHMPFEASGVPYHPGMVTNDSLLDKGNEIIASQHLSHLEETFHPSGPVDSSPHSVNPISEQYIAMVITPVPGKSSLAERTPTQTVYPFVPSSERMHLNFEPSGDLSARPSGQPVSQARIGSLSHLSETPSMTPNNILVRRLFSRLQSLFGTPVVASGTNLMEEALADSPSNLSEPPQVESGAVLAGEAGTTPISYLEELPLFHRDEITDMTSVTSRYSESLVPQPPLDKTLGFHQTSPLHWSAGHVPPSLTGEAIGQEMSGPAKAVASTIKNSSLGGYNTSTKVGLALAPIGRPRENIPAAPSSAADAGQEGASESANETMAALDPEALALEVYSILKRRLIVEKERTTSAVA
jgi:hypothetical protein